MFIVKHQAFYCLSVCATIIPFGLIASVLHAQAIVMWISLGIQFVGLISLLFCIYKIIKEK